MRQTPFSTSNILSVFAGTGQWTVLSKAANAAASEQVYDYVVLATGSFQTPRIPHIQVSLALCNVCCAASIDGHPSMI